MENLLIPEINYNFRRRLRLELKRRLSANPRYSLRAFALYLNIDHSRLSKILRGKRPLSADLIGELGQRLGIAREELEIYRHKTDRLSPEDMAFYQLRLETFEMVSDLTAQSILELLKLSDFRTDLTWMARRLNTSLEEVTYAVETLERVGLLKRHSPEWWEDLSDGFSTSVIGPNFTSAAHKKLQHHIIDRAKIALETMPIEIRDQSAMTMATNLNKIEEAKERIKNFRRELCAFLEDTRDKNVVLQLAVSLFPLTNELEKKV